MSQSDNRQNDNGPDQRRSFLVRAGASIIAAVLVLFPFAAGWGVVFAPLRRRSSTDAKNASKSNSFLRACPLDALPADGVPREFVVTANAADAWTRTNGQRIGSVFLTRTESGGDRQVRAFTSTCPHLGCAVEFDASEDRFECPCHESAFAKDGQKLFGPSLRGLDPLEVKIVENRGSPEVWVDFQRYRTGIAERIPIG